MPNTLTLPGDYQPSVSSLLKAPTKIAGRIISPDKFFLSDFLFRGPIPTPSGVVEYQVTKLDDQEYAASGDVRDVEPGGVYPVLDGWDESSTFGGTNKYGAEYHVTQEAEDRNDINPMVKGNKFIRNHMVRDDARRLFNALTAAATAYDRYVTTEAGATWDVEGAAYDALTAAFGAAPEGVTFDTLILNQQDAFRLAAVADIKQATKYTDTRATSPIYNSPLSKLDGLLGLNVVVHPNAPAKTGWLIERGGAGFVGLEKNFEVVVIPDDEHERKIVRGRKRAAPFVDTPGAFQVINGIFA